MVGKVGGGRPKGLPPFLRTGTSGDGTRRAHRSYRCAVKRRPATVRDATFSPSQILSGPRVRPQSVPA